MKLTKKNAIKQVKAEKEEIERLIKKLSLMTNKESLIYLKKNYYSLYSKLEDTVIQAMVTFPDVSYSSEEE